jgi:acetyltransferase
MAQSLDSFFHPRGIAILGASADPAKLGYGVARNLIQGGYPGAIHLVNPKKGDLFGHPMHPNIAAVPDPVDLAVVIVPAPAAAQALREVGQRGIRAAILTSGGFRETGPDGAKLEEEVLAACREYGIRLIGPNCIGLLDTHLPCDTTFLPPPPPRQGRIAFLSHSGAFCAAVIDWSRAQGFGFSRLVSLGNQADLTETDLLPIIAADPNTRAICLYLESLPDGQKFIESARKIDKPIIALKVGRTASGQKAAASHTGALAGSETALNAALERAGVLRAASAEQLFDWAQALSSYSFWENGKRIAILTNAGGPGVIAADALDAAGFSLADLAPVTESGLRSLLPPAASTHNPVDMLASASPEQYASCLELLLQDSGVDATLVILPPSPNHPTEDIADALIALIRDAAKPVIVTLMGSQLVTEAQHHFANAGIPTYPFPERAASALGALYQWKMASGKRQVESKQRESQFTVHHSPLPAAAEELVAAYGIETAPILLGKSKGETAAIANQLGFPVVLKIASVDIPHKSDIGGVLLNIKSIDAAAKGFDRLMEIAKSARPDARIDGVHVQRQIPPGQEVIIGMVRDPQFGPLMMFGSGGVEAEGLKDVAFALAPLDEDSAREMLQKTWAGRKLFGFRSIPPADAEAVVDALIRLSWLAIQNPQIAEIEINPLRVLAKGALAVDVRMK